MTDVDLRRLQKSLDSLTAMVQGIQAGFPPWMSLSQASKYCPLSRQTLLRLVESGQIYGRYTGGKWVVSKESIDTYFLVPAIEVAQFKKRLQGG